MPIKKSTKTVNDVVEPKTAKAKPKAKAKIVKRKTARYDDDVEPRSFRDIIAHQAEPDYYAYEQPSIRQELSGFFGKRTFLGIRLGAGILMVLIYSLALAAGYYYFVYNKELNKPELVQEHTNQEVNGARSMSASLTSDEKAQTALNDLKKIFNAPSDQPTVVIVQNVAQAKTENPTFYKDAQEGDFIFLFKSTLQAILYRYETNMVITVSSFTVTDPTPTVQPTLEPTPIGID